MSLGMSAESKERLEAAVTFELSHNEGNGHVFLPRDKLIAATCQLLQDGDPERLEAALPDIATLLDAVPSAADLAATLTRARAMQTLADLGLPEDLLTPSLRLSPYVRNRLTLMRLIKRLDFEL